MKATIELITVVELDVDDAVVEQITSPEWQENFYTFTSRNDALAWLADVLHEYESTERVDGLAGIGRATVREIGHHADVSEVTV